MTPGPDNGLAALAAALVDHLGDAQAASYIYARAILGPRGVFLPEGLGPVMVGMAKEIVSYADAHLDLCRLIVSYADLTHRVVAEGGELREISDEWTKVVSAARAALAAVKETP